MKDSTIIVLAIILVVVIAVPSAFMFLSDLADKVWDWIDFDDLTDLTRLGDDYAVLGVVLHYEDGTSREFSNENAEYGIYELSISDDGKILTEIEPYLMASVSYEGELSSWQMDSDLVCRVEDGNSITWHTETLTGNGAGEWTVEQEVWRTTLQMSTLDTALKNAGWASGTVWVWLETENTCILTFTDGQVLDKSGGADALLALEFNAENAQFNSLNVALYASPMLEHGQSGE